jgi:hypothetical protein
MEGSMKVPFRFANRSPQTERAFFGATFRLSRQQFATKSSKANDREQNLNAASTRQGIREGKRTKARRGSQGSSRWVAL